MTGVRNSEIGRILKRQRSMAGLTLQELCKKSGVSASYLARIERGERYPSAAVLRRVAGPLFLGEIELLISAGYLSGQPPAQGTERSLDPYVATVLAKEPVEVQRSLLSLLTILKAMSQAAGKA